MPRWLPDGRRVVVGGYERGGLNSLRILDTVTGDQEIVWSPAGLVAVLPGGISPDGQFAVVEATFDGEGSDVYTIDLTTGEAFNVTNQPDENDYFPSWWSGAP